MLCAAVSLTAAPSIDCQGRYATGGLAVGSLWVGFSAMLRTRRLSLVSVIWLVVGVIVASGHHFFATLKTTSQIGSAVLAILAWPLVLLHIHIGI